MNRRTRESQCEREGEVGRQRSVKAIRPFGARIRNEDERKEERGLKLDAKERTSVRFCGTTSLGSLVRAIYGHDSVHTLFCDGLETGGGVSYSEVVSSC